jgi:type I restriction enzyme, S subunit
MTSEWHTVRIGDLGRVVTGRTPPAARPDAWGNGTPFLTPTDFNESCRTVPTYDRRLSPAGEELMRGVRVPYGVAVSCIGWQMGKTVLITEPTVTNQQINTIVYNPSIIDGLFLFYSMTLRRREIFLLGSSGSRTPIVKKSLFEDLELQLPPMEEQKRIAATLGALDDKIDLNRQMNRSLERLARAFFRSWFVDFDPVVAKLGGREPHGLKPELAALFPSAFSDSPLGPIPVGWEVGSLAEGLTGLESGSRPRGGIGAIKDGVPSLGAEHIGPLGEFDYSGVKFVPRAFFDEMRRGIVSSGDVALYKDGANIGRKTMWAHGFPFAECAVNEHVFLLRASPELGQEFLYLWLDLPEITAELISRNSNSAQPGLNQESVGSIPLLRPPAAILKEFTRIVGPLFTRVFANALQSRDLRELRDLLSRRLLQGGVRTLESSMAEGAV